VWPVIVLVMAVGAGLVAWLLYQGRRPPGGSEQAAEVLRRRFAAGEIDEAEFRERMSVLGADAPSAAGHSGVLPVVAVVAEVLVVMLVVALLASQTVDRGHTPMMSSGFRATSSSCDAPSLPGQTVDVTLTDMGRGAGMMGGTDSGYGPGMMSVLANPSAVSAGQVSFLVWNGGMMVHELVVLPLPSGGAGSRTVGADGTVNEDGSLGEASATCAEGAGEGIAPGSIGWVTLDLPAGRYELVCNLPGHYAAGMFTELDVG
jgi:uncharacterized cupredoxin-like copper-binding protein